MRAIPMNNTSNHPLLKLLEMYWQTVGAAERLPSVSVRLVACHLVQLGRQVTTPAKKLASQAICLEGFREDRYGFYRTYLLEPEAVAPFLPAFSSRKCASFYVVPKLQKVQPIVSWLDHEPDETTFTAVLPQSVPVALATELGLKGC